MRGLFRAGAAVLFVGVLLAGPPAPEIVDDARAGDRYKRRSRQLAPGLRLIRILDRVGPNRIKVLKFNPKSSLTLDVELAQDRLPGRETTSSMAKRRGAIAATNGTFGLSWGRPIGLFAEDTHLQASPLVWGNAIGARSDEEHFPIGHPKLEVTVSDTLGLDLFNVRSWNAEDANRSRVSGYTPVGAPRVVPPAGSCAAHLVESTPPRWAVERPGITRTYEVQRVRCAADAMKAKHGVVLAAARKTRGARRIRTLEQDQLVDLTWTVGWNGVVDAIAGNPVVVSKGKNVGYRCPAYFCSRTPRTAIGVTGGGRLLLVTVDGARPGSVGMTLRQLGRLLVYLNARRALNVDGGGSTTMVVRGKVINRPTDAGGERAVSSSILVLRGEDHAEPDMGPPPPTPAALPAGPVDGPTSLEKDPAVTDPGSTGGLLDALERGGLGRRVDLPPGLERTARRFEAFVQNDRLRR